MRSGDYKNRCSRNQLLAFHDLTLCRVGGCRLACEVKQPGVEDRQLSYLNLMSNNKFDTTKFECKNSDIVSHDLPIVSFP